MITCVDLQGRVFDSEAAMARANGIKPNTFNRRKLVGTSYKACFRQNTTVLNADELIINGVKYSSLRALCKAIEVSYSAVYSRMRRKGISVSEAIYEVVCANRRKMVFGG